MRVKGIISPGHGVASGISGDARYPEGTLRAQFDFFKERGLDLSPYYLGTINLDIAPFEYTIKRPKLFLRDIKWSEYIPPENFYFFDLRAFCNSGIFKGLVYMPDPETKTEHEQKRTILELILPKIPDLSYGDIIEIEIPGEQISFENMPAD